VYLASKIRKKSEVEEHTCHPMEIMLSNAMNCSAKVLSTAHIRVMPIYMHTNTLLDAK
jgi:hypothetical protein